MTSMGEGERAAMLRTPSARSRLSLGATTVTVVADAAATSGAYSAYRIELAPRAGGASPHFHRTFAESFLVLDGEVDLYDGAEWVVGRAGAHLFIPPGGIHGFRNLTEAPATMLMLSCPAVAREAYFAELAAVAAEGRALSEEEWAALFARHDQYMVR